MIEVKSYILGMYLVMLFCKNGEKKNEKQTQVNMNVDFEKLRFIVNLQKKKKYANT